ncbi:Hsp20/alpha crystallin family protein [Fredinandcohnia sp. 179-A 10B2 NHS]|uniref:Hsp20/alpha crystallin family protein n=1 Tax=Fredinandcohnia sp. 179-A 10B2 NHS TaxID=3235176 RepID=UPI0039A3E9F4
MNNFDNPKPLPIEGLEDWMRQFFDDPFTSPLDSYQFRVDLFETQDEYIVEAELTGYLPNQINLKLKNDTINIQILESSEPPTNKVIAERIVTLPFDLEKMKIKALFRNEILEIFINKHTKRSKKKKHIKIKVL